MASGGKMFAEHRIKFLKKMKTPKSRKTSGGYYILRKIFVKEFFLQKIKALKIERQVEYKIFAHVKDTIFGEN